MKAITIRNPWAYAVAHLGKDIENRDWNTRFRGEVLIHAAKGCTRAEYEAAIQWCADRVTGRNFEALGSLAWPELAAMPRGGIVARARIVDVIAPFDVTKSHRPERAWHVPESFGFVLEHVRPTPFVPCVGALGFWEVPASVLAALEGKERAA